MSGQGARADAERVAASSEHICYRHIARREYRTRWVGPSARQALDRLAKGPKGAYVEDHRVVVPSRQLREWLGLRHAPRPGKKPYDRRGVVRLAAAIRGKRGRLDFFLDCSEGRAFRKKVLERLARLFPAAEAARQTGRVGRWECFSLVSEQDFQRAQATLAASDFTEPGILTRRKDRFAFGAKVPIEFDTEAAGTRRYVMVKLVGYKFKRLTVGRGHAPVYKIETKWIDRNGILWDEATVKDVVEGWHRRALRHIEASFPSFRCLAIPRSARTRVHHHLVPRTKGRRQRALSACLERHHEFSVDDFQRLHRSLYGTSATAVSAFLRQQCRRLVLEQRTADTYVAL